MKLKHTKVATLAATLITFGSLAGGVNGAVIFTQAGNNLSVQITSPLSTVVTTDTNSPGFLAIRFINTFSASAPTVSPAPSSGNISISASNATPFTSSSYSATGVFNFEDIDDTDFAISWTAVNTVLTGDVVNISPGTLTLSDYFTSGGTLPDNTISTFELVNGSGLVISNTTAVPEPSSAFLLGLGAVAFMFRRKRAH